MASPQTLLLGCLALAALTYIAEAKVYKECELAKKLVQHGFQKKDIDNWICLVKSESSLNTKATHVNGDKSKDFGLFQINDRYWCEHGKKGKDCHVSCEELLKDDIQASMKCAKVVFKRHHFSAWAGWKSKCQGKKLPSMSHCF